MENKRAIFLDRDGVINVDDGYTHRIEDFQLMPGAAAAIRRACAAGYHVFVVTNQGGIALGYFTEKDLQRFHDHMLAELNEEKAIITDIAFCPHHPRSPDPAMQTCTCRKPDPGMILSLAEKHSIDLANSAMIGDRETDVEAGQAAGVKAFLFDGENLDTLMQDVLVQLTGEACTT